MSQPFTASKLIDEKMRKSTATVASKVFEYKLARKTGYSKELTGKKLELTHSLVYRNAAKDNEYYWDKSFRDKIKRVICVLKIKHDVATFMIDLWLKDRNLDKETAIKQGFAFYNKLISGTPVRIAMNSEPENPRVLKVRRKINF